jgi:PIN domain nuclease of toxin-antitoxin system
MSCFELVGLVRKGRIRLGRDIVLWIRTGLASPGVSPLSVTPKIGIAAGLLPASFPGDPADRLIYASAQASDAVLVTGDRGIRAFDPERTLW